MEAFQYAANALAPLILEIALGCFLRKIGLLGENFFRQCRQLVFFVVVPVSTFCCIYDTQSVHDIHWGLSAYVFLAVLALFALGFCISLAFRDRRKRGVIIQATYRSNYNIIATPLSQALGGQAGLMAAAVLSMTTIPQFNILAVIGLTCFQTEKGGRSFRQHLLDIVKNPMIVACAAGIACLLLRWALPKNSLGAPVFSLSGTLPFLYSALSAVGKMSTPLALITLGGLFDFRCLRGHTGELVFGTILRTVVSPLIGVGGAVLAERAGLLTVSAAEYACLIAVFGSPMATISGIMAAQMGGDDVLADQLVVSTTITSAFTIFATVCLLRFAGLL